MTRLLPASLVACSFISLLAHAAPPLAAQQEMIFPQFGNTTGIDTDVESSTPGAFGVPVEAADDFDVVGSIERVYVVGNDCFGCAPPAVAGVRVRFYEWTSSGPGALEQAWFVAAGDPGLLYDPIHPAVVDVTLPQPFEATGKHFLSVQMELSGGGYWGWWVANFTDGPHGSRLYSRTGEGAWGVVDTPIGPLDTDLAFALWGTDATPPGPGTDPHGQWIVVDTPDPVSEHAILRDVEVVSGADAWAVGEWIDLVLPPYNTDTKPLAMHWDGTQWSLVDVPFPNLYLGGNWCDLQAVRAAAPDDVWAAGSVRKQAPDGFVGTHLFVTHWDGTGWTEVPSPVSIGGSGNFVDDIAIVAPDDVWFVGDWIDTQGGLGVGLKEALTMHWDGSAFTLVDNPFFDNQSIGGHGLTSISAVSSDDIWAVGGGHDGDYVAFSEIVHWNGDEWEYEPGPRPGWFHRLYAVEALASDDVWACGDYQDATGYHAFFIHWDGNGWTLIDADAPGGGAALIAFSSHEVYSSGGGIARWDGAAWSPVASFPSVLGPSLLAIDAAGTPDTLWAVGREIVVDDLLSLGVRLVPGGDWTTIAVQPRDAAPVPALAGDGVPASGEPVSLTLAGAASSAATLLVLGTEPAYLPFRGSTLVPVPEVVMAAGITDEAGRARLAATWSPAIPVGTTLWLQFWTLGRNGLVGSDGLRVTSR